jgi:hypothetical protein
VDGRCALEMRLALGASPGQQRAAMPVEGGDKALACYMSTTMLLIRACPPWGFSAALGCRVEAM